MEQSEQQPAEPASTGKRKKTESCSNDVSSAEPPTKLRRSTSANSPVVIADRDSIEDDFHSTSESLPEYRSGERDGN